MHKRYIKQKINMFKKIVSNLPFSPALVDQLGFYVKRLKSEETTRRLGLIFVCLALVVQSLAVFQPPESANASNDADFIKGGAKNVSELLSAYDSNTRNFKDIMNYLGITRSEISKTNLQAVQVGDIHSWGLTPLRSYEQGERQMNIYDNDNNYVRNVYFRPLKIGTGCTKCTRDAWVGSSSTLGWFAIKADCGNLMTKENPVIASVHRCNNLTVTNIDRTSNRFTVDYSLNHATLKNITYTITDSSKRVIDSKTTNLKTLEYTNNQTGKYKVKATINSFSQGKDVSDTSTMCTKNFEIKDLPAKPPKPIHRCNSLKATSISRKKFLLSTDFTLTNAILKDITYTIRNSSNSIIDTRVSHFKIYEYESPSPPGEYNVQATVNSIANGINFSDTSPNCKTSFTVNPEIVPESTHVCNSLNITSLSRTSNRFTAQYTNKNSTFKKIIYTIRNSEGEIIDTRTSTAKSLDYTLDDTGEYTVQASVYFDVNGKELIETREDCSSSFIITAEPEPEPEKCIYNPEIINSDPSCLPCPGNDTVWINSQSCIPNINKSKSALNITQKLADASTVTANSGDLIKYTLAIENTGTNVANNIEIEEQLSDIVEYSTIVDMGGGTYNAESRTLSWPDINLAPNAKQTREFTVKILDKIPATAQGNSYDTSYDCTITNTFGNSIDINIACPASKIVEQVAVSLPVTGPRENIMFAGIVLSIVTYFYARSRQQVREIRLIRKDVTMGTI